MKNKFLIVIFISLTLFVACSVGEEPRKDISTNNAEETTATDISSTSTIINESSKEGSSNEFSIDIPSVESSEEEPPPNEGATGQPLDGEFGEYCFAEEKDGKKILTIFSEEQIADLNSMHESDEGLVLTSDEIQFIIKDTLSLFISYDMIHVRSLDGSVETYYGLPFYGSEEYYACFNGFNTGNNNASFHYKHDILNITYKRIAALHSACFCVSSTDLGETYLVLSDSGPLTEKEQNTLIDFHATVYLLGGNSNAFSHLKADLFYFEIQGQTPKIDLYKDISRADKNSTIHLLADTFGFPQLGQYKYDLLNKNVVIELWEEKSQSLVARIRIDERNDPETLSALVQRAQQITIAAASERYPPTTNYRVAVYFNGFSCTNINLENFSFKYYPDGNINDFALVMATPVFWEREDGKAELGMQGCSVLTEYVNELLLEKLNS